MPLNRTMRSLPLVIVAVAMGTALFVSPRLHGLNLATTSSNDAGGVSGGTRKGNLFSAISLSASGLASWWQARLPKAVSRFPLLEFTMPEDLHITVVYIGGSWQASDLHRIRPLALVLPRHDLSLTSTVVRLGYSGHAVAVEFHGQLAEWTDAVIKAKEELNTLGIKRPDRYDRSFRPHVTLARRPGSLPAGPVEPELAGFQQWLTEEAACDPLIFRLVLGPKANVRLLLADAPRPSKTPEYIPVEDLLE